MELNNTAGNAALTTASDGQAQGGGSKKQENGPIKQVAIDFSQNTTAHGIARLVAADSVSLKFIWFCICGLCWGVFLWQALVSIQNYFAYDVSYDISVDFRILEFPAVTVCNINPVRQSKLTDLPLEVQNILEDLGFLDLNTSDNNETNFDWNYDIPSSEFEESWWNDGEDYDEYDADYLQEANLTTIIMSRLTDEMRANVGHQKNDFILDCMFNGAKCSPNNFTLVQNKKYGNCYSFNIGRFTTDFLISSRPGPSTGLQLTLFIEEDEYLYGYTESVGAVVLLHPHRNVPFPDENGIEVPPGFSTSIGVRLSEIKRLAGNFGDCLNDWPESTVFEDYEYSVEACRRNCYQTTLIETCDCHDPVLPRGNFSSTLACGSGSGLDCMNEIHSKFIADALGCKDECPQRCGDESYKESLSMSVWPSESYGDRLFQSLSRRNRKVTQQLGSLEEARRNLLQLKIFYQELNYESIKEKPALTGVGLLSNLGGLIGLYIGASVISLFEFLEFIITIIVMATRRARKAGQISNLPT